MLGSAWGRMAAAPSPIKHSPCFRPVNSSSRVFIHHRHCDLGWAHFPLKRLELPANMHPVEWVCLSVRPFIIIGVTLVHRVTSKLLFPLLRTAGGDKKALQKIMYLDICKPVSWATVSWGQKMPLKVTAHLEASLLILLLLGKWSSGIQRISFLFINGNEEQGHSERSSKQIARPAQSKVALSFCTIWDKDPSQATRLLTGAPRFSSLSPPSWYTAQCMVGVQTSSLPFLPPLLFSPSFPVLSFHARPPPHSRPKPTPFLLSQALCSRTICKASCRVNVSNRHPPKS